ncbi:MAG: hypothetical protein HPY82_08385 [Gammaproteobacteria bacterium]|nr:hypothetical protein [Gammaproteobacteria bacterium]
MNTNEQKKSSSDKPHIYVPSIDVVRDFESARKCLPGLPVSPERSYKLGKHWQMCNEDGGLIGIVPPIPATNRASEPTKSTAKSHASNAVTMKGLEAFGEEFAKAVGKAIVNAINPLKERISELESRQGGMKFMGEFQDALSYPVGAVVKYGGALYCAVRDIQADKSLPGRHGAGWTKMS